MIDYLTYQTEKKKLEKLGLPPREYEKRLKELARKAGM